MNGDGNDALLLHFSMWEMGLDGDEDEGHLHWENDGEALITSAVGVVLSRTFGIDNTRPRPYAW